MDQGPTLRIMFEILLGAFVDPVLNYYIVIQLSVFIALMIIAWLCYPRKNKYSIMRCTMSFLGSPDAIRNPHGWYFFSIAIIWKMLSDIPVVLYMFRYLSKFSVFAAYVTILLYGVTILSGIIVGFFPDSEKQHQTDGNFFKDLRLGMTHNIAAVLSFGASMLANLTVGLFYLCHPYTRPFAQWLPPLFLYVAAVTNLLWSQIKWQMKLKINKKLKPWPGNGWYSLPLNEWVLFFALEIFIYWNVFII